MQQLFTYDMYMLPKLLSEIQVRDTEQKADSGAADENSSMLSKHSDMVLSES